jgi:hypothetical protein
VNAYGLGTGYLPVRSLDYAIPRTLWYDGVRGFMGIDQGVILHSEIVLLYRSVTVSYGRRPAAAPKRFVKLKRPTLRKTTVVVNVNKDHMRSFRIE